MILFCLPYAGGSSGVIYHEWNRYLHPSICLEPIELRGRGKRFNEGFYHDLEEAVEDIFGKVKNKIFHDDYAIYGHSMGSLLAYELYYRISEGNLRLPKRIFFSGYRPPIMPRKEKRIHLLPDKEFIEEVVQLGGTPQEVAENEELIQLFTPILRNDFKMLEQYRYEERKDKITCDISVFAGTKDDITLEQLLSWKYHGDKEFKVYYFEGNHFFINSNAENIIANINHTLVEY